MLSFIMLMLPPASLLLLLLAIVSTTASADLNFRATFSEKIIPFEIDVDERFLQETLTKVALARFPAPIDGGDDGAEGPTFSNATTVKHYWQHEYDWLDVQKRLNAQYKQFTTTVHIGDVSSYAHAVPLHFVHLLSARSDAVPLLFLHGWPGSFLEVGNIMTLLADPPNASLPAFHVVAPSIPGFAFSPAPAKTGFGDVECAHAMHALMKRLGYDRYVIQAGDVGGIIMRFQAHFYPENVAGGLSNFWPVSPNAADRARYSAGKATEDEAHAIRMFDHFFLNEWAYGQIHQQKPLRIAYSFTDSPMGLAMWIYDLVKNVVVDSSVLNPAMIITWTMMHYIQGPYGALRIYKEGALDNAFNLTRWGDLPYAAPPLAISEFPLDVWYRTPLEWAQRTGNVQKRYVHDTGGHFPAWETPHLLLPDIWDFFGDLSLTRDFALGTGELRRSQAIGDALMLG